jgi:putative DNA-invertase from lambdoid prophage Rac
MSFDGATTDPVQKAVRDALIGFMAAAAQAQAEATRASQLAGIEHAKGRSDSPYLGRKPAFTRAQFRIVQDMLGKGMTNIVQIAKAAGIQRQTVYRLKSDPVAAEAALAAWGL